jgi:hypothetical protein
MTLKAGKQVSIMKIKIESPIDSNDLEKVLEALAKTELEIEVTFSPKGMIIILPAKTKKARYENEASMV